MQLRQRLGTRPRVTELHTGTDPRVGHPLRQDRYHARLKLDVQHSATLAHLAVAQAHSAPKKRVPAVADLYVLPDMGRMNLRWP
jgi:hypothetical protein